MYLLGILSLVVATAALPVLPDPPNLPKSNSVAAHQDSKIPTFQIQNAATVFSPPWQLPNFHGSILKQKAYKKQIYEDRVKQKAKNSQREKESVVPEKSLEIESLPDLGALPNFKKGFKDCEICANILIVASGSAPVANKKDDDTVKNNIVMIPSVFIPTPPELPEYSILKKQTAEQKQKSHDVMKQEAEKSKNERETVILDQEKSALVELPPNSDTYLDSQTAPQVAKVRDEILSVTTNFAPEADKKDNEKVRQNMIKIDTVVLPPPPELPPFDYSILRKQKADLNIKSEYFAKQSAEKQKEDKEEQDQVKVPPIPPTLPDSVLALPVSEVISDGDNVEPKINVVKVDPIVIPPPPELPQFDYSVLKSQIADQKRKYNIALKQETKKFKDDKEVFIPDLATLPASVAALPVSEVISASKNVNEGPKMDMVKISSIDIPPPPELSPSNYSVLRKQKADPNNVKIATVVMPPPPELPPFDYSILRKQKADLNSKSEYFAKQSAEKQKEDKEEQDQVKVPPNPPTLPDSVLALPVSEVISDGDNVEPKINVVKVDPIVIPPPPELPQFDYSVLKSQIADQKRKYNIALKQESKKFKEDKEVFIPDLATLPASVAALPVSEMISASKNVNEEPKMDMVKMSSIDIPPPPELSPSNYSVLRKQKADPNNVKIATVVMPPPPELPPFDYSILRKQKADLNIKSEYFAKQSAEKQKEDKEEQDQVKVPPNPPTLPDSVLALPVSEVISDGDDVEPKINMVKVDPIVIPPPPELSQFDYSVLKNQISDQKQKYNIALKQETKEYKEDNEAVILDLEKQVKIEVPPKPPTLSDSVLEFPVSEVVTYDGDNEESKMNMVKVAPIVIPPPQELPQFDYSVLKNQIAYQNRKYNNALKQEAKKSKEEKESEILDLATSPDSVAAIPVSAVISASKNFNEEPKMNMFTMNSIDIPPPPELPPTNRSVLRKQKADPNLKSDFSAMQSTEKYKEDKGTVIVDLEKQVQIKVPSNPPTLSDSVLALPVSEVISDGDNVEAKINMVNVAPIVIPPPPELPQFDYSILKNQIAGEKEKFNEVLILQEAEKSKKEKGFAIGKPVEIKIEEPKLVEESKFVGVSKPIEEFKPVEEFKPSESVKHSGDIPVIIQLTIPSSPFLSKLTSNCPPLPSFGLNWPYHRSAMSRCPHLIYPKFDIDGKIYTN